jgi:hypothetical protein
MSGLIDDEIPLRDRLFKLRRHFAGDADYTSTLPWWKEATLWIVDPYLFVSWWYAHLSLFGLRFYRFSDPEALSFRVTLFGFLLSLTVRNPWPRSTSARSDELIWAVYTYARRLWVVWGAGLTGEKSWSMSLDPRDWLG